MPAKSEAPPDKGGASRNSCGGCFRDLINRETPQAQLQSRPHRVRACAGDRLRPAETASAVDRSGRSDLASTDRAQRAWERHRALMLLVRQEPALRRNPRLNNLAAKVFARFEAAMRECLA
jgi:hypothetical protein